MGEKTRIVSPWPWTQLAAQRGKMTREILGQAFFSIPFECLKIPEQMLTDTDTHPVYLPKKPPSSFQ